MNDNGFEQLGNSEKFLYGPPGLLCCGFSDIEKKAIIVLVEKLIGPDFPAIFVSDDEKNKPLSELLSYETRFGLHKESSFPRTMILSGCRESHIQNMMGAFHTYEFPPTLWATVTPISEQWPVSELIHELTKERDAFKEQMRDNQNEQNRE